MNCRGMEFNVKILQKCFILCSTTVQKSSVSHDSSEISIQKYADLVLKKNLYWQTFVLRIIFVENLTFFFFDEKKVKRHLFEIDILCNIIYVCTVTFGQFI